MLPLLKNLFKLMMFLGLFCIGPNILAQTDTDSNTQTETTSESNQIEEDHDTKKLDKLIIDYNKDTEKVLKDAEAIQNGEATEASGDELGIDEENAGDERPGLKIFNKKPIDPKTLKEIKYSEAIKVTLAPLQKMSEAELMKVLKENTKGSKAEVYVDQFPKLAVFAVRLIKDPEALPMLTKILDNKDQLIRFSGIMIGTILIAFFLKRLMRREGQSVLKTLCLWFLRFIIMTSLRISILYYFYSAEITPTFNIAVKTFL